MENINEITVVERIRVELEKEMSTEKAATIIIGLDPFIEREKINLVDVQFSIHGGNITFARKEKSGYINSPKLDPETLMFLIDLNILRSVRASSWQEFEALTISIK